MELLTSFRVKGHPAPQGSKILTRYNGLRESSRHLKPWRDDVRAAANLAFGEALVDGPIFTYINFHFSRPKSHYVSGRFDRPLKADAPRWHFISPDCDKLHRSTNDALTGAVWIDDRQVCLSVGLKSYVDHGDFPGASIAIYRLSNEDICIFQQMMDPSHGFSANSDLAIQPEANRLDSLYFLIFLQSRLRP